MICFRKGLVLGCLGLVAASASAQLRVSTWNVTNFSGADRVNDFKTAIYGAFEGRAFAPDLMIGQEYLSQAGVDAFLNLLNTASNSPADWAAAPFVNGNDTDSAFFYRSSKLTLLNTVVVATGSSSTSNVPRNILRYDVRLSGYTGEGATLSLYSSHMKSGNTSDDLFRRLLEAQLIRADAQALPAGRSFILGGDFNIPTSNENSYQELVQNKVNNLGRFFDPINTPGSWNNVAFRFVHTQDPASASGMDDRFDQLLMSFGLVDGGGFDYIGAPASPFSTSTWNDPNHSYRCWGNDGTSWNAPLTVSGNTMVGATIAQALRNSADGQGHLPVFADLRVPPKIASVTVVDFGRTFQGAKPVRRALEIANGGDIAKWTPNGVAQLNYNYTLPRGFYGSGGAFAEAAGGGGNLHEIYMDTRITGDRTTNLIVYSNSPEQPARMIQLRGYVVGPRFPGLR